MKPQVYLFLLIMASMFGLFSCNINNPLNSNESKLVLKVPSQSKVNSSDSVIYTGKDIQWFIESTGELQFVNPPTSQKFQTFGKIKFYLGNDSLFTASVVLDFMSSTRNDLVLHLNSVGKFYLEDGYPAYIDNLGSTTLRAQNKEKRAAAWALFIAQLKTEGKYKE